MNPLVPAGYDIAWSIVALVAFALLLVAVISLARSAKRLTAVQALAWTLLVVLVPVVGPVAWLSVGRRAEGAQQRT